MPAPTWFDEEDWVLFATVKSGLRRLEEAEQEAQRAAGTMGRG